MKATKRMTPKQVLNAISKLPSSKATALAKRVFINLDAKDRTPGDLNKREKKTLVKLHRAGLSYRVLEAVAHMTPRRGMSAYNALEGLVKKVKPAKAKAKKTVKAKTPAIPAPVAPVAAPVAPPVQAIATPAPVAPPVVVEQAPAPVAPAPVAEPTPAPVVAVPEPALA